MNSTTKNELKFKILVSPTSPFSNGDKPPLSMSEVAKKFNVSLDEVYEIKGVKRGQGVLF